MKKSILSGLLLDLRQVRDTLADILQLQHQVKEGFINMTQKAQELKDLIAGISSDITEIDGDLDEVISKIGAITDLPTQEEWDEIKISLASMKDKTAAIAAKVPETPTP